jgi:iron complex transport system substrate-binding protein
MKYGGAVVGGGLLAGCAGQSEAGETPTETGTDKTTESETTTTEDPSWEVCMKPVGCRTFDEVPEDITVYGAGYADIVASLGQFDRVVAMNDPKGGFPFEYYDRLPGVDIDVSNVTDFFPGGAKSADKEIFYEVDPDLNLIDPVVAKGYLGLDDTDIEEIEENVAPFFGSWMRRPQFTDNHPYYSLYEGTERVARVFQAEAQFEALRSFHDETRGRIRDRLPDPADWPTFGYINMNWWGSFDTVYANRALADGYQNKVFHDLEFDASKNAFGDVIPDDDWSVESDLEALLEADPEVIVWQEGYLFLDQGVDFGDDEPVTWEEDIVGALREDPVAGQVRAVREGNVVPGTETGAGPVSNLFNMEALAKQLFPDEFGEYDPTRFPKDQTSERLFDRQRLADIVNGDI